MLAGRLVLGDILGQGAFGVVLKAKAQGIDGDKNDNTTVAVKTLKGSPFDCPLSCGILFLFCLLLARLFTCDIRLPHSENTRNLEQSPT